ncbi:MAG: response regulator [Deferribacterales bacterium]
MENTDKLEILFAEDEEELRRGVCLYFRKFGYKVTEAANGLSCIQKIKDRENSGKDFDLILLDVMMPEMTGLEVLDYLHRSGRRIPVLLITGYLDVRPEEEYVKEMVIGLLHKPFSPSELIESTHTILQRSKTE